MVHCFIPDNLIRESHDFIEIRHCFFTCDVDGNYLESKTHKKSVTNFDEIRSAEQPVKVLKQLMGGFDT